MEYLEIIRRLGVVNMFQSGQFLSQTKEYLTKYFDLHRNTLAGKETGLHVVCNQFVDKDDVQVPCSKRLCYKQGNASFVYCTLHMSVHYIFKQTHGHYVLKAN